MPTNMKLRFATLQRLLPPPAPSPYPEVEKACPRHSHMKLRWEGRVLRCPHVEYELGRDSFGLKRIEKNRCHIAYPLRYFFTDDNAGALMDMGAKWWELELEQYAAHLYDTGQIDFPWDKPPAAMALKVSPIVQQPFGTDRGEDLYLSPIVDDDAELKGIDRMMREPVDLIKRRARKERDDELPEAA